MTGHGFLSRNLTDDRSGRATFLTLTLLMVLFSTFSHADSPPATGTEAKLHISEIASYLRKEGLQSASLLPSDVRNTLNMLTGTWHPMSWIAEDDTETDAPSVLPQALTDSPAPTFHMPFNLESSIHHKGFLPTHDAIMLGTSLQRAILDDKLQFTIHPFYGQSWHSVKHYWGSEMSMNIAQRPDDMPWGKITMNYTGGEESLTDHGRGIDLHGDVNLTNGWQFTSGIRQNSTSGDTNYALMRWKLDFP